MQNLFKILIMLGLFTACEFWHDNDDDKPKLKQIYTECSKLAVENKCTLKISAYPIMPRHFYDYGCYQEYQVCVANRTM